MSSMTDYIKKIQKKFITQYKFKENPNSPGLPMDVPDGEYPMKIDGKLDNVRIENGKIHCCNFEEKKKKTGHVTFVGALGPIGPSNQKLDPKGGGKIYKIKH